MPVFIFKDEQQKKESIVQSLQLARKLYPRNPLNGIRDHTDLLIYLGIQYLVEQTLAKKAEAGAAELKNAEVYLKSEAMLRKEASKFFSNPTKTTLRLSGLRND